MKKSETKASNINSQGNKKIPCLKIEHFRSRREKVLRFVGLPQNEASLCYQKERENYSSLL